MGWRAGAAGIISVNPVKQVKTNGMVKKTRIKDIAAACGVSIAAVSRALKGQPGLSEETRQRILSIAEAEG